jgi:predicted RNA-binding Zn-ribbon protein involved in translation (DUF1610 family)
MQAERLVLFPKDARSPVPDAAVLLAELGQAGLIGNESKQRTGTYLPGPRFMALLTFLGCSPTVAPGDDAMEDPNQYFVELPPPTPDISLIRDDRAPPGKCPACGNAVSLPETISAETNMVCDHCGFAAPPYAWHWHHRVGFGRVWINVWGVHEGEAVPGEELLQRLEKLTGFVWNYAYCR